MKNPFAHIRHTVKQQLGQYVQQPGKKYFLLAVSGGPDSVLLTHIFRDLGLRFCIAHINYGLRGKESDTDETFTRKLAETHGVKYYVKKARIKKSELKGASVQMVARELRYLFFDEVQQKEKTDLLVLAHHANDQVETVLLHFFRGCGIDGLTGMKTLEGNKFRPLLQVPKKDILAALGEKKFHFRTDSSNLESDYKRNFLRNRVIPLLEEKWPGVQGTILENIQRFSSAAAALQHLYQHTFDFNGPFALQLPQLLQDPVQLDHFRKEAVKAGFHLHDLEKLLRNKSTETKTLPGPKGNLEKKKDRLTFVLSGSGNTAELSIKGNQVLVRIPGTGYERSRAEEIDALAVKGPLTLRPWQPGDRMIPLGMKSFKKISDLLTDLKLPLSAKRQVLVLCDGEKILWLVGFRIDDRVKIKQTGTGTRRLFLSIIEH